MTTYSIPHKAHQRKWIDWPRYDALKAQGQSDSTIAPLLGMSQPGLSHRKKTRHLDELATTINGAVQSSADRSSHPNITTVQIHALDSADTLSNHETRLQVLESFVATLQAQALQPPVQQITVQPSAYALPSAESVQTWTDPEDAKPERWNLWLPRGLKRRIEASAQAAGIAPSQLVQRLLMSAVHGQEVGDA
jgi:hypothetical protein